MPTALFVCYGGGHAQMVIPVVRALSGRVGWSAQVLAATTAGPEMARQHIQAFGYATLLRDGDGDARRWGLELLADAHDPATGIAEEESIAYLGLCFADLVHRFGEAEARRRYGRYGRHAFLPLGPLRRAIEAAGPNVVVTTNSPKSERAALLVAREMGTPALYIEDLLGIHTGTHLELVPPPVADCFAVGSRIAAENLARRYDLGSARFELTGNPAFDRLAALGDVERDEGRTALGVAADELAVVYMDSGATPSAHVSRIARALGGTRTRMFTRRHPNARSVPAATYARELGSTTRLAESISLDRLLAAADVILATASTVAVEAVLLGRRVIQLGDGTGIPAAAGDRPEDLPLFRYGCATLAHDLAELPDLAAEVGSGRGEIEASARRVFVPPGHAAKAICDVMEQLVR